MAGENLDISSDPSPERRPGSDSPATKCFVGVRFECCRVYARIYINSAGAAYEGHCPRCCRRVRFRVGPGGSDARFFTIS